MNDASRAEGLEGRALGHWLALADVAAGALAAAEAELALVIGHQAECAATIGGRLHDLPAGNGDTADHLPEIIAALQAEDSIRQHQEQVGLLLSRLRGALVELAAATPSGMDDAERRRLAGSLVAGIPLDGLRQRLELQLTGRGPGDAEDAAKGDVELF